MTPGASGRCVFPDSQPSQQEVSYKASVLGQGQVGIQGDVWEGNIPLRGDTLQELRSASWQLEQLLKWKKNVRYMATCGNYLTSIKCWSKLHSQVKEGNET